MLPRRRRAGSESEPLVSVSGENSWSKQPNLNYVNSAYPNNVPQDYYLEEDFPTEDYYEPEPVMAARDRTNEFVNTIQTLQGRNIARAVAVRDPKKSKAIQSHSEFMLIAKNIGRNIASTYAKLEKLTLSICWVVGETGVCDTSLFKYFDFLEEMGSFVKRCEFFHIMLMLRPMYALEKDAKDVDSMGLAEGCKPRAYFIVEELMRRDWI